MWPKSPVLPAPAAETPRPSRARDPSEDVRAAALRALAPDLGTEGRLASLVERVGRTDPSELVRSEAERILGSSPAL